jgi:hypothetical protein
MIRDVLIVAAGVVLSGVLGGAIGFAIARDPDARLIREHFAGDKVSGHRVDALSEALDRADFRITWIYCPAVLIVVGTFVGLLSLQRAWQLAVIATAPFTTFFSVGVAGIPAGLPLLAAYSAFAGLSAWSAARITSRARTHVGRPAA